MSTATQQVHRFTLLLSAEPDDDAFGRLKAVGCDDALFGVLAGVPYAGFDREAPSLADAVLSAIRDVESAGVDGLVVEGVKADELDELDNTDVAFVGYADALLRARRLAPKVAEARALADRFLTKAS